MYLDDMLDSDTADIIREQLKQKIGEQGYGADFLANNTTPAREAVARQGYSLDALLEDMSTRDKTVKVASKSSTMPNELKSSSDKETGVKTGNKDDLEPLSTDELASLLRGEMNDLDISLKQDMPELNKSLDINNYRPKE